MRHNANFGWILPPSMGTLSHGVPPAPPGTIFALGADGGYAVPPRNFTLYFGRAADDVHVTIGAGDPHVSRVHGTLTCHVDSRQWWLRNQGRLPIQLPYEKVLLSEQEMPVPAGYTRLMIGAPWRRPHLLEIHVVGVRDLPGPEAGPADVTEPPDAERLTKRERLVLTALAQRYLRQDAYPQPVSWQQVADDLNRALPETAWTGKIAAHVVAAVRGRLSRGAHPVPGLLREDDIGEPLGNTLNHNLILHLLKTVTLMPSDLRLLDQTTGSTDTPAVNEGTLGN